MLEEILLGDETPLAKLTHKWIEIKYKKALKGMDEGEVDRGVKGGGDCVPSRWERCAQGGEAAISQQKINNPTLRAVSATLNAWNAWIIVRRGLN